MNRGRRGRGRRPARDGAGEDNCNGRNLAKGVRRKRSEVYIAM